MEPKTPQLSAYDLLGYLVPGLAFAAVVDLSIAHHLQHIPIDYGSIILRYSNIPGKGAIPILLFSYYLGHMVSFVSSITIERNALWRYGHPMIFLIDSPGTPPPAYLGNGGKLSKSLRFLTALPIAPISVFEFFSFEFGIIKNYVDHLGFELRGAVKKAMADLCQNAGVKLSDPGESPGGFELLAIHYALETAPAHVSSLRNYVVLYGFLRSMTLVLVLMTWLLALHVGHSSFMLGLGWVSATARALLMLGVGGLFCSTSYGAFLKFWMRYNREALMAVTVAYLKNKSPGRQLDS